MEFMNQILEDMQYATYSELKRKSDNRQEWRAVPNQPTDCEQAVKKNE